ncbi:MAG: hypothetical protein Q8K75_10040 [Chlamydiales bacterium]|nr:hypothetical protein [Chlamydiales bacterium]
MFSSLSSPSSWTQALLPSMPCTALNKECITNVGANIGISALLTYALAQGAPIPFTRTAVKIISGLFYHPMLVLNAEQVIRTTANLLPASLQLKWAAATNKQPLKELNDSNLQTARQELAAAEKAFKAGVGSKLYSTFGFFNSGVWTKALTQEVSDWTRGDTPENIAKLSKKGVSNAEDILKELYKISGTKEFKSYLAIRTRTSAEIAKYDAPSGDNANKNALVERKVESITLFGQLCKTLCMSSLAGLAYTSYQMIARHKSKEEYANYAFEGTYWTTPLRNAEHLCNAPVKPLEGLLGSGYNAVSSGLAWVLPAVFAMQLVTETKSQGWQHGVSTAPVFLACAAYSEILPAYAVTALGGLAQSFGLFQSYDANQVGKYLMMAPAAILAIGKSINYARKEKTPIAKAGALLAGPLEVGANCLGRGIGLWAMGMMYSPLVKGWEIGGSLAQRGWRCTMFNQMPA